MIRRALFAISSGVLLLILAACGAAPVPEVGSTLPAGSTGTAPVLPVVAQTETATATLDPTVTLIPTATATPMHPLSIESMRMQSYPGSQLVFEEVLAPAANYDRFVVSYLSE